MTGFMVIVTLFLLFGGIIGVISYIYNIVYDPTDIWDWIKFIGCAFCLSIGIYFVCEDVERESKIEEMENIAWTRKGCPVYKTQCGSSKSSYRCERKAAVIGRNKVGDIFVNGYPICPERITE